MRPWGACCGNRLHEKVRKSGKESSVEIDVGCSNAQLVCHAGGEGPPTVRLRRRAMQDKPPDAAACQAGLRHASALQASGRAGQAPPLQHLRFLRLIPERDTSYQWSFRANCTCRELVEVLVMAPAVPDRPDGVK